MSSLRSVLDHYRAQDLRSVSDERLEADFAELQQAADRFEGERLRRLAEIQRRRSFRSQGYLSATSWLAGRFRMAWGPAARLVQTAKALEQMPGTREALASGEVSSSAVRVLTAARVDHPKEFRAKETSLVEAARTLGPAQLRSTVEYWRQSIDRNGALKEAERLRERRRLHVSTTALGMVRMDGELDPENGETVLTALRCVQARTPGDDRTPEQRRADALGEACRRSLDSSDRPTVGGERPHVTVMVDLQTLEGKTGRACEFDHTGPIHPEVARRWACDASVTRVITKGGSEPLDVGRRTPVVPAPLRRAVVVRDRRCRFPGCDRPPAWADAHHVVHWADGGPTALANLVLLCRPHHRLVHEPAGFGLQMVQGRPRFTRPDGTIMDDGRPP